VFAADPKLLSRLEPQIRKVLLVDPNPAAARMLGDLLRGMGAQDLRFESDERHALDVAAALNPTMIFVERSGPRLDGESFTKRLRRSDLACRKAPVVMVTGDTTANSIKGARDAGVHEFLRKPFTGGDLLKRVEVIALKPRDWVEAVQYVGPDRRRFNSAEFIGQRKRKSDKAENAAEAHARALDQAVRILKSAVTQFDSDPHQAKRAIVEQTLFLKRAAEATRSPALASAAAGLETVLSSGLVNKAALSGPASQVLALFEINAPEKAA
jgi:CheY-like chemotaxis protein